MKILQLALFTVAAGSLSARDLTLEQAVEMARQHSYELRRSEARSSAAQSELRAARAERFPTFTATGMANYVSDVPTFSIQLPVGPRLERELGDNENYQTDFRVNLPLFTGGRIGAGIDLARASHEMYEALETADLQRIAHLTRIEYFGLYRANRLVTIAEASRSRAEVINRNIESLFEAGAADSTALLEAGLALSRASLGISQSMTNRRVSEIRLATLVGLPLSEPLVLIEAPREPEPVAESTSLSDKAELRAAKATVEMAAARARLSRADYFPALSAFGGYSYGKPNLDRFGNSWNDYFTVGATLNWSFNLGGKSIDRSRASARWLDAARYERSQVEENLTREANLALEQLRLAYTRYQNSVTEFGIATDQFRLAQVQHSNGVLSSNRLLEIEADLTASEASLAAALSDYYIAYSTYVFATGSDQLTKGNQ